MEVEFLKIHIQKNMNMKKIKNILRKAGATKIKKEGNHYWFSLKEGGSVWDNHISFTSKMGSTGFDYTLNTADLSLKNKNLIHLVK